ncbi:hypothetical protein EXS57_02440 [Candidatus Kaiserbacteria bacterium]|nr:hypothetical protein [Candidatus Kaiserbacteria bacterium]
MHPVQQLRKQALDVQHEDNPARAVMQKCIGTYKIQFVVEEDLPTVNTMKREGLISFLCTLLDKDGHVLSQGRGSAMLNENNYRYLSRSVHSAFNSSIADSIIRATKVLDIVRTNTEDSRIDATLREAYKPHQEESSSFDQITPKQRQYLLQLASINLDEGDGEQFAAGIDSMTRQEASEAIKRFAK